MTVDNLAKALPFEGRAAKWKEEIYFETPVKLGAEKPKPKVEVGTIAYWPMGSSFASSSAQQIHTAQSMS